MVGSSYSRARLFLGILLTFAVLGATGCGGSSSSKGATVSGVVKVDGTPANQGSVTFIGTSGSVSGQIGPDGTYRAVDVPVGAAQVTVTGPLVPPGGGDPRTAIKQPEGPGVTGGAMGPPVPIPQKYGKAETSGLSFPVKSGTNKFDIDLTAK